LSIVQSDADRLPVTSLRRLVELLRTREKTEPAPADRDAWRTVRGEVHLALAHRGSGVALYDLRETLEQPDTTVGAAFLAAAHAVADISCLEAVAARWSAAAHDRWLRDQFEQIFRVIVERSESNRDATIMTRLLKKQPGAGPLIATVPRRRASGPRKAQPRPRQ
jgi:hypothetical protein